MEVADKAEKEKKGEGENEKKKLFRKSSTKDKEFAKEKEGKRGVTCWKGCHFKMSCLTMEINLENEKMG